MEKPEFLAGMAEVLRGDASSAQVTTPLPMAACDSITLIEVIALIDSGFGVTLSTSELMECRDLNDLWDRIQNALPGV
jgi:acyl carrier protein